MLRKSVIADADGDQEKGIVECADLSKKGCHNRNAHEGKVAESQAITNDSTRIAFVTDQIKYMSYAQRNKKRCDTQQYHDQAIGQSLHGELGSIADGIENQAGDAKLHDHGSETVSEIFIGNFGLSDEDANQIHQKLFDS